jgi:SAM-dependent methyltransferase
MRRPLDDWDGGWFVPAGLRDCAVAPGGVLRHKHGAFAKVGWGPRLRRRFGYATPAELYAAVVDRLVGPDSEWLDVGCGRDLLPDNPSLAGELARRCRRLVGVDESANLDENPFVHERAKCGVEDYRTDRRFDLVTLRMVAEHVTDPAAAAAALGRLTKPGGRLVVLTVNLWSPVTWVSRLVPFRFHHRVKRLFWGGDEKDTFPVAYRMNTRPALRRALGPAGFRESAFAHAADLTASARFRGWHHLELTAWRILNGVGVVYPENCLFGIYERMGGES